MSSIRSNYYFNNPQFAQAASNLAQLFAPPSASELASYANAKATREEAERRAEQFNYAKDPNYSRDFADRLNYAINGNANNTFYKLDQADATTRYGYDVGSRTELEKQRLANEGELQKLYATPITVGENATVYVPGATAHAVGLPQALSGQVSADLGEVIFRPDGTTLRGDKKPLNESEWQALQNASLRQSGQLTDQMLVDRIMGERAPVEAVGKDGKPVYMSPGAAIRTEAEAFVNRGAEARPVNYQSPDGKRGTATTGANGQLTDTQTGQPIPAGSVTFGTNIQGSEADTGMSTKTNQTRSVQIRGNVTNMNGLVNEIESLVASNPAVTGMAGDILSFVQDAKQVVNEFGQKLGNDPSMPVTPQQASALMEQVLPSTGPYNPVYRKAAALVFELAYANAKLNNPGGEVSRYALERELEQLGQGLVGNDKALMAVLDVSKGRMRRALDEADVLDGSKPGITVDQIGQATGSKPAAADGGVEKWDFVNGKLQRVQ